MRIQVSERESEDTGVGEKYIYGERQRHESV